MYNRVWIVFMGNPTLVRDEMFHNLIDTAALALTHILIDCVEDFQEVGGCRHRGIPSRFFIIPYLEEPSWYSCELVRQSARVPVEIT
jgi:hypothetical protein